MRPTEAERAGEGRHSGNGFSVALAEGALGRYFLCGYHKRYNAAATFDRMIELSKVIWGRSALSRHFFSHRDVNYLGSTHLLCPGSRPQAGRFKGSAFEDWLDAEGGSVPGAPGGLQGAINEAIVFFDGQHAPMGRAPPAHQGGAPPVVDAPRHRSRPRRHPPYGDSRVRFLAPCQLVGP